MAGRFGQKKNVTPEELDEILGGMVILKNIFTPIILFVILILMFGGFGLILTITIIGTFAVLNLCTRPKRNKYCIFDQNIKKPTKEVKAIG